jgi:hypothetical protein
VLSFALCLAGQSKDPAAQARARDGLGSVFCSPGDYPKALAECQQAATRQNAWSRLVVCLFNKF